MDDNNKNPKNLPEEVSPVRYIVEKGYLLNEKFLHSFEEAKTTKDAVAIMEGDWGGQIYLVCQIEYIKCGFDTLMLLLQDLDDIAWKCNDGEGRGLYFEIRKCGEGILGGMGSGIVNHGLWLHKEFIEKGLEKEIKQVISGISKRMQL